MQGKRESMEDAHAALLEVPDVPGAAFFGVFDGHGGARAAQYVAEALPRHVVRAIGAEGLSWEAALSRACETCDAEYLDDPTTDDSGSTGIFALMSPERFVVGCVGDSQAVLSTGSGGSPGAALDLCVHHKPDNPDEQARIEAANGKVVNGRIFGVLGVSRAFGDRDLKTSRGQFQAKFNGDLVSAVPDVVARDVAPGADEFLLLACDGLFDVLTPRQAINHVRRGLADHHDVQRACEELVKYALRKLSTDNVSAIIVAFPAPSSGRSSL